MIPYGIGHETDRSQDNQNAEDDQGVGVGIRTSGDHFPAWLRPAVNQKSQAREKAYHGSEQQSIRRFESVCRPSHRISRINVSDIRLLHEIGLVILLGLDEVTL